MKIKQIYFVAVSILCMALTATGQLKVGSNPTAITTNTNLELEAIDGTKVVVKKDNGYVGIGTASPQSKLEVIADNVANSGLGFRIASAPNAVAGTNVMWMGTSSAGDHSFIQSYKDLGGFKPLLLNSLGGNVGIGTTTPTSRLEVSGAATNSIANVVTAASIDYSVSNLAATNNTGTAITLTNLKNGGAYTLVFTSTAASGTVVFTAVGFTFVEVGTVARTAGKKHIYNFVVIGTEVYVTMGTQN